MRKDSDKLFKYLKEYFTVYLTKQRNCSIHTLISCKQTWNLFLKYMNNSLNIKLENISFDDISRQNVVSFLDTMEAQKGWTASTRNQRLACIRSFFKYVYTIEPTLVVYFNELKGIPLKKDINKSHTMEFMSIEAIKTLLQQPDTTTKMGIRDLFFMVLMYDTAARDCEMLGMKLCDFNAISKTVYLMGKGSKPRVVPVTDNTVKHFQKYANIYHPNNDGTQPMFYTIHREEKTPMSDDNVARFIDKYSTKARIICPEIPKKVHPHMFRRSRAMHLYRSGMPLAILAEWLGHGNPETTLIYAYADTEMKRKAIEKASKDNGIKTDGKIAIWEDNEDILSKLCGLT